MSKSENSDSIIDDKSKQKSANVQPFTKAGETDDEVVLEFPEEQEYLFVSKAFLCYISPVFQGMLSSSSAFKEQQERKIVMKEKKYADLMEFLRHFHPRIKTPITPKNVYTLLPLVHEYMNEDSVTRCKNVLRRMVKGYAGESKKEDNVRNTLQILHLAIEYGYQDLEEFTIEILAKWNTRPWAWTHPDQRPSFSNVYLSESDTEHSLNENTRLYGSLPDSVKLNILTQRLLYKESDEFYKIFRM